MKFSQREIRDLAIAWVTLGAAFTVLLNRPTLLDLLGGQFSGVLVPLGYEFLLAMVTAGVGFLFHELAHKVVAIKFGQIAEFRADFSMLFIALVGAFMGFLFAAPGAVHHRGRITDREHGLIAIAGPVTNLLFAGLFFLLSLAFTTGLLARIAGFGVLINLLLAGFNMIPFGPLDGRTVLVWNKVVYAVVAIPSVGLALFVLF